MVVRAAPHVGAKMTSNGKEVGSGAYYRCAGPNCGIVKHAQDRWWLMWTSIEQFKTLVLYLAPWNEELAQKGGTLHVCGELCAQKLQSQFMGNVRENQVRRGV
jgi:hypothetical protein